MVEAAVIGVPHDSLGEEIGAAVALKVGAQADPDQLREFVKERVVAYKYPRHIWLLDELPKGPPASFCAAKSLSLQSKAQLGTIAAGKSERGPAKADKRFADAAWQENPLLNRLMQAYLAAVETADGLFADAALDWRDSEKMRFALDNVIGGLAPTNNPLISPLGWKALIETGV